MSRDGGRNDKFFDIPNTKFFFNDAKDQNNELGNNAGSYTPNGELSTEDSLQDTQNLLRNKFFLFILHFIKCEPCFNNSKNSKKKRRKISSIIQIMVFSHKMIVEW